MVEESRASVKVVGASVVNESDDNGADGEGCWEGTIEGASLGMVECDGALEGTIEGVSLGMLECDGVVEGIIDGATDGTRDADGASDGARDAEGAADGTREGASLLPTNRSKVTIVGLRVGLSLFPIAFFFLMASSKASC